MAKNKKIRKYRKPINLNIGMLIFGAIFVYVIICVFMYFQTSHVARYEVKEGSLATNNVYRGIALRSETVVEAQSSGYINFFAREGEKVSNKDLVYTVDETGRLKEQLSNSISDENSLSERELATFRSEIVSFLHSYEETDFNSVYKFKNSLYNTVLKLANSNMLQNISDISGTGISVNFYNAPRSGIVEYWTDGYEELTGEQVNESVFDEKNYEKHQLMSNDLIAAGDAAYKLAVSEHWSVVIPVEKSFGQELLEEQYVKVLFLKNQYESWGQVSLHEGSDGKTYAELKFTNSMITFADERFLDVELIIHDEKGLKIPNSSIVQKEFFLIPEEFVGNTEEEGHETVIRQCYLEDGTISSEVLETGVYSYDEEAKQYYVAAGTLGAGDILHKKDGQDTYIVSTRATLTGVYNMNKGYADFKEIEILYQNDEYAIVRANTRYGLNVYDYIVLNAEEVSDDQFINE